MLAANKRETRKETFLTEKEINQYNVAQGFPGGSDGKESAGSVGELGLIPGSGRSPRKGHGNPL